RCDGTSLQPAPHYALRPPSSFYRSANLKAGSCSTTPRMRSRWLPRLRFVLATDSLGTDSLLCLNSAPRPNQNHNYDHSHNHNRTINTTTPITLNTTTTITPTVTTTTTTSAIVTNKKRLGDCLEASLPRRLIQIADSLAF